MTETLKERIKRHEGLRLTAYQDSEGHWTIGYGFNLKYPIPQKAADIIFDNCFVNAIQKFYQLPIEIRSELTVVRREVLIEMIFQLGLNGVLNFKRMCAALVAKDYEEAACEIMDSKAARQCPKRFQEYADAMRRG